MQGDLFGNWSLLSIVLAVPLVIAAAALVSYMLGPAGDPGTTVRREGSVTRTLRRLAEQDDADDQEDA